MSLDEKRETLLRLLDELFPTGSRDNSVAKLRGADVVATPINMLPEAASDPDEPANGYVTEIDYREHDKTLEVYGSPSHFPGNAGAARRCIALGAHDDQVIVELGYSIEQIGDFRVRGII